MEEDLEYTLLHMITYPAGPLIIFCAVEDVPTITHLRDTSDEQLKEDYSCVHIHGALKYLYAGTKILNRTKVYPGLEKDVIWAAMKYPTFVTIEFYSHVATVLVLNEDNVYYVDYYQETDRLLYPNKFIFGNFALFRMDIDEFYDFLRMGCQKVTNRNIQDIEDYYTSFIGPYSIDGHRLTGKDYIKEVEIIGLTVESMNNITTRDYFKAVSNASAFLYDTIQNMSPNDLKFVLGSSKITDSEAKYKSRLLTNEIMDRSDIVLTETTVSDYIPQL